MAQSREREQSSPGMESVFCDLCHSNQSDVVVKQRDLLLEVSQDEFTIVRCRNCGLVYLNPRPSTDRLGSYYPSVYYPPVQAKSQAEIPAAGQTILRADQALGVGRLLWVSFDSA